MAGNPNPIDMLTFPSFLSWTYLASMEVKIQLASYADLSSFFQMQETPFKDHVALVSFHLEVDAQLWFQLLKQEKEVVMMGEFKEGLHSCYGPT